MGLPDKLINYIALDKDGNPRNKTESIFALCKVLDRRYSPKTDATKDKRIMEAKTAVTDKSKLSCHKHLLKFQIAMYAGRLKGMEKAYDEKLLSEVNKKIKLGTKQQAANEGFDKITFDALLKNVRNKNGNNDFMKARNKKIEKKIKKGTNKENTTNNGYSNQLQEQQTNLNKKSQTRKSLRELKELFKTLKELKDEDLTAQKIKETLIKANKLRKALINAGMSTDIEATIENIKEQIIEKSMICVKDALALEPNSDNKELENKLENKIADLKKLDKTMDNTSLDKWSASKGKTNELEQIKSAINAYDEIISLSKNSPDCSSKIEKIENILKTLEVVKVVKDGSNTWETYLNKQKKQATTEIENNRNNLTQTDLYKYLLTVSSKEALTEKLKKENQPDEEKLAAYMLICKNKNWKLSWRNIKGQTAAKLGITYAFPSHRLTSSFIKIMNKYDITFSNVFKGSLWEN